MAATQQACLAPSASVAADGMLAWMCVLQKVLPAVVTVVEQVSSNMRQSLPTFQKELLNVIHMNSTHSDQVKQHY